MTMRWKRCPPKSGDPPFFDSEPLFFFVVFCGFPLLRSHLTRHVAVIVILLILFALFVRRISFSKLQR
jgi:hypothetical protein